MDGKGGAKERVRRWHVRRWHYILGRNNICGGAVPGHTLSDGGDARLLAGWAEEEAGPHGSASV